MVDEASMEAIMKQVKSGLRSINLFRENTIRFFETHEDLTQSPRIVHSVKSRMKDLRHLREKIQRKSSTKNPITPDNIFDQITDESVILKSGFQHCVGSPSVHCPG